MKNKKILKVKNWKAMLFFALFFVLFCISFNNVQAGTMTFIKEDHADSSLEVNQDRITDNVWITRGDDMALYNAAVEDSFDWDRSPADTEWVVGVCGDNPENNIYFEVFGDATGGPRGALDVDMCIHLITDDIYLDIKMISWTCSGGFSYIRTEFIPEVVSIHPEDNNVYLPTNISPTITFDRNIYSNTGNIEIKKISDDSVVETIGITSNQITGWGTDTITIDPESDLPSNAELYINIDNGAIKDIDGLEYEGIDDDSTWNFTTKSEGTDFYFEDSFFSKDLLDTLETTAIWDETGNSCFLESYDWTKMDNSTSGYDNISNDSIDSYRPQLSFDSNDNLFVTWYDNSSGNYEIYISQWNGSEWVNMNGATAPNSYDNISNTSGGSYSSQLSFDSNDNLFVTWYDNSSGNYEIYISQWNGSEWVNMDGTTAPNLYDNISNNSGESRDPQLSFDSNDNLFVTWHDNSSGNDEVYISQWNGSEWVNMDGTTAPNLYDNISNNSGESRYPQLSFDSNDSLFVIWKDYTSGYSDIYISQWNGSEWVNMDGTTAPNLYDNISNNSGESRYPQLSFDSNDNLFVTWTDYTSGNNEVYITHWNGSQWVNMDGTTIPNSYDNISNTYLTSQTPQLSFNNNDNLFITWTNYTSRNNEVYITHWNGSQWVNKDGIIAPYSYDNISNNSGYSRYSQLSFDSNDNLFVIWEDDTSGNDEIYISRYSPGHISPATIQSIKLNGLLEDEILRATLTAEESTPGDSRIEYFLSNDGGLTWTEVNLGEELIFNEGGTDLRWKAILYKGSTPTISSVMINYSTELEEDDDDDQGEDQQQEEQSEPEEELDSIIKIKSIKESCDSLEIEISTGGEQEHEKLDSKIKIENTETKEKTEQKIKDFKTDSHGRAILTIGNLKQNTEYKIKVKYKESDKKEYTDWSGSKKATTTICQTEANLASAPLIPEEDQSFPGELSNPEEQETAKEENNQKQEEPTPIIKKESKTEIKEEDPKTKGFWNTLLGGGSSDTEGNSLVKVLAVAATAIGGAVLIGGTWMNRKKWFAFAFTWMKKRNWRVFDVETGDPIPQVMVSLESPEGEILEEELTDNKGHFKFNSSPGNNTIKVEKEGYQMIQRQEKEIIEEYGEVYTGGSLNNNRDVTLNINIPMRKKIIK